MSKTDFETIFEKKLGDIHSIIYEKLRHHIALEEYKKAKKLVEIYVKFMRA